MRIVDLDQRSDEWVEWRSAGLGGSDAPVIMGASPYQTAEELLEKKKKQLRAGKWKTKRQGGLSDGKNAAMARGVRLEPTARQLYTDLTGIRCRPVCVIHDDRDWQRGSLDGLSMDDKIVQEFKAVNKYDHAVAVGGQVPPHYWPQVQHLLSVTGLDLLHYWSYSESTTFCRSERAALVVVRSDPVYLKELVARETEFWDSVLAGGKGNG